MIFIFAANSVTVIDQLKRMVDNAGKKAYVVCWKRLSSQSFPPIVCTIP
jgi:hypothetical protein